MGTCGCCSVLINGEPRLSCLTLAVDAEQTDITTVEGLAGGTICTRYSRHSPSAEAVSVDSALQVS